MQCLYPFVSTAVACRQHEALTQGLTSKLNGDKDYLTIALEAN
ncbi:hypothetical protein GPAL_0866 [Glaciecola pallidula DSM 14239 = ACAM 615]|uniref:Uncharacterized protein n=1 Tax=Brumicola pallidula DSM 14239 = ACAM 615 TaxID=1121922 RepID=K6YUT4_9ALTE|nr:hypothetical protein GPAL_0866 [Glaciecola pallidula DSM 14239 = ACAM 615]